MIRNITLFFAISAAITLNAQIVTEVSSLPDEGDVLDYVTLNNIPDTYLTSGANVTWDFTQMSGVETATDIYAPASDGPDADLFPEADLLVEFAGATAYAKRNTTNIEVVGIGTGGIFPDFEGLESQTLSNPFVIRRAPVGYEDSFSGATDIAFSQALDPEEGIGELINGINPIEGSSIDSLRATATITRTEEIDSWGTIVFEGQEIEVLRLVQNDEIAISIEFFLNTVLIDSWVDISTFLDPEALGIENISSTNYIFLSATDKSHIVEINVDNTTDVVSGRQSADYNVGLNELALVKVSVFPNPAVDEILLDGVNVLSVSVLDQTGREVISSTERLIDVSELANGTYFIKGKTREGQLFNSKFIKQ